jgi:hypothetical protein
MAKFDYGDVVTVRKGAKTISIMERGSIIAIIEDASKLGYLLCFPPGTVYSVEFEGGDRADIHESDLESDH